jgi:predicted P-loop ATPase
MSKDAKLIDAPEFDLGDEMLKEQVSANRNKRQIEQTEKYLQRNYDLRYNTIRNEIEISEIGKQEYQSLNENNLFREFQHNKVPYSINKTIMLMRSDFVPKYNPIEEYFTNLPPYKPAEGDYIAELCKYINAFKQEAFNQQFKMHMVRTVACAMDESFFNKHCLVLVQPQQSGGKSTFIRYLTPEPLKEYYTENLTVDKDGQIALCENFIINLDELATLSRQDINSLKSIFSKVNVKVRPPFEKKAILMPRRASFFGSTNDVSFLTDHTGSVRWLCFRIEKIDWGYSKTIDINRVWAQAYYLYKNGFRMNLDQTMVQQNEINNSEFKVVTTEMELLHKYFQPITKEKFEALKDTIEQQVHFYTSTEIMQRLIEKTDGKIKIANSNIIGKSLQSMGYKRDQMYNGSYNVYGYYLLER